MNATTTETTRGKPFKKSDRDALRAVLVNSEPERPARAAEIDADLPQVADAADIEPETFLAEKIEFNRRFPAEAGCELIAAYVMPRVRTIFEERHPAVLFGCVAIRTIEHGRVVESWLGISIVRSPEAFKVALFAVLEPFAKRIPPIVLGSVTIKSCKLKPSKGTRVVLLTWKRDKHGNRWLYADDKRVAQVAPPDRHSKVMARVWTADETIVSFLDSIGEAKWFCASRATAALRGESLHPAPSTPAPKAKSALVSWRDLPVWCTHSTWPSPDCSTTYAKLYAKGQGSVMHDLRLALAKYSKTGMLRGDLSLVDPLGPECRNAKGPALNEVDWTGIELPDAD